MQLHTMSHSMSFWVTTKDLGDFKAPMGTSSISLFKLVIDELLLLLQYTVHCASEILGIFVTVLE